MRRLPDEGPGVEGTFEVGETTVAFRPGDGWTDEPAIVIDRARIRSVTVVPSGLGHRIEVRLVDETCHRFDYGVLPVDRLRRALDATSFGATERHPLTKCSEDFPQEGG